MAEHEARIDKRRRLGWGVTARLIGLVMVPLTVMFALTGSTVFAHRASAAQASRVEQGVQGLDALVALRATLNQQEAAAQLDVRFAQVGVTRALAMVYVGFDWSTPIPRARARSLDAVAALGAGSPVSADALGQLYSAMNGSTITTAQAATELDRFGQATADAVNQRLDDLRARTDEVDVLRAIESLRIASNLLDITTPMMIDLSGLWFPPPGVTQQSTNAAMARFGADSASYDTSIARMRQLGSPAVRAQLDEIEADPHVRALRHAAADTLAGQTLAGLDSNTALRVITGALRGSFVFDGMLDDLVRTASSSAAQEARHLADAERARFITWLLGAAGLAAISVGVAMWLARTIARPLKDLATYAQDVNEGQLDADPSGGRRHGPRETRLA